MLTIICGEDTVKSRDYFIALKNSYHQKGFEIQTVQAAQIAEIQAWIAESQSLFFDKKVIFVENLESKIIRSKGRKPVRPQKNSFKTNEEIITEITENKNIELIDWEEGKQEREIKLKTIAVVKEFKISTSIFKLQDACYPENISSFIQILSDVVKFQDEQFIFAMITRLTRSLILAKDGHFAKTVQTWQRYKLEKQALLWPKTKLLGWYEGLFRIDLTTKSGSNPYGVLKSLEILACHYL